MYCNCAFLKKGRFKELLIPLVLVVLVLFNNTRTLSCAGFIARIHFKVLPQHSQMFTCYSSFFILYFLLDKGVHFIDIQEQSLQAARSDGTSQLTKNTNTHSLEIAHYPVLQEILEPTISHKPKSKITSYILEDALLRVDITTVDTGISLDQKMRDSVSKRLSTYLYLFPSKHGLPNALHHSSLTGCILQRQT